jgi:lipopolysaccharide/colanic/teichoic acid biosynthesis glycosyltransferase
VLLSPLLILVALLITSLRSIFSATTVRLAGQPFKVWKFRTISTECPNNINRHVLDLMASGRPIEKRDKELALVLWWSLRKLGLDELPQLINRKAR